MTATNQFAAHVGLDWADKKHDVCVQFKNGECTFQVIAHTLLLVSRKWITMNWLRFGKVCVVRFLPGLLKPVA
ncbi:hypothetical protein CQW88_25370 [Citrobacter freundii]|nr:hypothetical protein CQW88_25370 [Citrobacter freundii]